jgi:Ca2+-binding EF-hand superfamily protein
MRLLAGLVSVLAGSVLANAAEPLEHHLFDHLFNPTVLGHAAVGLVSVFDTDDSNGLSLPEFRQLFFNLGVQLSLEQTKPMFDIVDADQDGGIDAHELAEVLLSFPYDLPQRVSTFMLARLPETRPFPLFSEPIDLQAMLEMFPSVSGDDNPGWQVVVLLAAFDKNHDGRIELPEVLGKTAGVVKQAFDNMDNFLAKDTDTVIKLLKIFDADKSGAWSVEELSGVLLANGINQALVSELSGLIMLFDTDKDGSINIVELRRSLRLTGEALSAQIISLADLPLELLVESVSSPNDPSHQSLAHHEGA